MGQNDLMADDNNKVVHTVKEFVGNDCRTSSVTGILAIDTYKSDKRTSISLEGCIHLCDGNGLATWSFYDTDKARLIKSAEELEKMAAYICEFAAAIRANADVVGEFDINPEGLNGVQ